MPTLETDCLRTRKWTRSEYHLAADLGVFGPDERLELLEGEIVEKMSSTSNPHAAGVSLAADTLRQVFRTGYYVREEKPIVLSDHSEPEPDIVVVRGNLRNTPRHPTPHNIVLVMEVSELSLAADRATKAATYAQAWHIGVLDFKPAAAATGDSPRSWTGRRRRVRLPVSPIGP